MMLILLKKDIGSSLHCNGRSKVLFVNGVHISQFEAIKSEIKSYQLWLGNTPKDFTINNIKYSFSTWVFFYKHSQIEGQQGKGMLFL